eukprot:3279534-Pyramimonas_sp.AAC.1
MWHPTRPRVFLRITPIHLRHHRGKETIVAPNVRQLFGRRAEKVEIYLAPIRLVVETELDLEMTVVMVFLFRVCCRAHQIHLAQ